MKIDERWWFTYEKNVEDPWLTYEILIDVSNFHWLINRGVCFF